MEFKEAEYPIHIGNNSLFTENNFRSVDILKIDFRVFSYKYPELINNGLSDLREYRVGTYIGGAAIRYLKIMVLFLKKLLI